MLKKAYPFFSFLDYFLREEDQYSLQSPLLFETYKELKAFRKSSHSCDLDIEDYRNSFLASVEIIEVDDFGAGSKHLLTSTRKVASITKFSTTTRKFAQLYQFFCSKTTSQIVLELGSCVGITCRYLSRATKGKIYSFEGSSELARIAAPNSGFENLEIIQGNLQYTLPTFLKKIDKVDFALIDATHTFEATMDYFRQLKEKVTLDSIIVIGDIHWSKEMNRAWEEIKADPAVRLSLDFYECGVIYFQYPGAKANYVLAY